MQNLKPFSRTRNMPPPVKVSGFDFPKRKNDRVDEKGYRADFRSAADNGG